MLMVHRSAPGGTAPSSASVALPLNVMTSPTANVAPTAGASIVGTGASFVTSAAVVNVQVVEATSVLPAGSATPPAPSVTRYTAPGASGASGWNTTRRVAAS